MERGQGDDADNALEVATLREIVEKRLLMTRGEVAVGSTDTSLNENDDDDTLEPATLREIVEKRLLMSNEAVSVGPAGTITLSTNNRLQANDDENNLAVAKNEEDALGANSLHEIVEQRLSKCELRQEEEEAPKEHGDAMEEDLQDDEEEIGSFSNDAEPQDIESGISGATAPLTLQRAHRMLMSPGAYSAGGTRGELQRQEKVPFSLLVGTNQLLSSERAQSETSTNNTDEHTDDTRASTDDSTRDNGSNSVLVYNGLAEANAVPDEDIVDIENLPVAHDYRLSGKEKSRTQNAFPRWKCAIVSMVAFIAIVLVFSFVGTDQDTTETAASSIQTTIDNSDVPTSAPTISEESIFLNILIDALPKFMRNHTRRAILDDTTAQHQAFQWLYGDPNVKSLEEWKITQRFALATFYFSTNGESWLRDRGWLDYDVDECDWFYDSERIHYELVPNDPPCGTDVNGTNYGVYENIWLEGIGVNGTLPLELFSLTSLKTLSTSAIAYNVIMDEETGFPSEDFGSSPYGLFGPIPTEIGMLSNLERLYLNENKLSSSIPSEIGRLTKLVVFDLNFNEGISGQLPTELGLLTHLQELDFVHTDISGPIFTDSLMRLTNLHHLHLNDNSFTGSITTELLNFPNLTQLGLDNNHITGALPTELGLLTHLQMLYLKGNMISGSIPSEIGSCTDLIIIEAGENDLTGSLPQEVAALAKTGFFRLQSNALTGTIPTEIGLHSDLYWLDLSNNDLSGTIPNEMQNQNSLHLLFLENNPKLSGIIPENMTTADFVYRLKLEETGISGTVPEHLCRLGERMEFTCNPSLICGCDCTCI